MLTEEFKTMTNEVLTNLSDQGKVSEILSNLVDDYTSINANLNNLKEKNEQYIVDMESLRNANMKLFLKIGDTIKQESQPTSDNKDTKKDNNEDATPTKNDNLTFDKLFTEKGGLK